MSAKKESYLERLIDAEITQDGRQTKFIFQTERIGLKNKQEIEFLKNADSDIQKEIEILEDELVIEASFSPLHKRFESLFVEDEKTRWIFAQQLLIKVERSTYPRLNLAVCPENIVFNSGMTPFFLHYGVIESLPPFEKEEQRVWLETKATIAAAMDSTHSFEDYVNYHESLELNSVAAAIMSMESPPNLHDYISGQLEVLKETEKTYVNLPQKKWKITKYLTIGLGILLLPSIIYIIHFLTSEQPKKEAYLASHQSYLGQKYSQVVTTLGPYSVEDMPYVVLYELAHSYVINEALTEDQKENVLANITLQTDENYLKYWIYIGRNEAEKAVDLAREMEDGELITYGLLMYREEVKANGDLTGEEKQQVLAEIDSEVDEYRDLMEEEAERLEEEKEKASQDKPESEQKESKKEQPKQQKPNQAENSGQQSQPNQAENSVQQTQTEQPAKSEQPGQQQGQEQSNADA